MPNRILRDGILASQSVASLDWAAEVFYRRLMSIVDDYGRTEALPELLRTRCYPLQVNSVRVADIIRWIAACEKADLIVHYAAADKRYLEVLKFGQRQRTPSKWPPAFPNPPNVSCCHLRADDGLVGGAGAGAGAVGGAAEGAQKHAREAAGAAAPLLYSAEYERFWLVVSPHKRKTKRDGWKAYQEAVKLLKNRERDPHGFLLEKASTYYQSPLGQTPYCNGPGPFLRQGCYDDDPRAWERKEQKGKTLPAGPGQIHPNEGDSF